MALELLMAGGRYIVAVVTSNKESNKARKLAEAGAELIQADMNDLRSLMKAEGSTLYFH